MAKRGPKSKKPPARAKAAPPAYTLPVTSLVGDELAEFERIIAALHTAGLADRNDIRLVESAARTHVLLLRAAEELASAESLTDVAANGTAMPHPMVAVVDRLTSQLSRLYRLLGLTSASRARPAAPPVQTNDPWEGLLGVVG
jgi:P27 family predicted phage terminase small subunit